MVDLDALMRELRGLSPAGLNGMVPPEEWRKVADAELARWVIRRHLDGLGTRTAVNLPPYQPSLAEELALPRHPIQWTVEDLWPRAGNVVLSARKKAGKTTLAAELIRALADRASFLGKWPGRELTGRIGYLNFELGADMANRWLERTGILHPERVAVWHLRGYRLDIMHEPGADALVDWAIEQKIELLVIDPLRRMASASAVEENSNSEVGAWLDRLDEIKARAGISDLLLIHHAGHGADDRARGASVIGDWPDALWRLTRDGDARHFAADGRDVDVPEVGLVLEDGRLSASEGNRRTARIDAHVVAVLEVVGAAPPLSGTKIETALRDEHGLGRNEARDALREAKRRGYLRTETGENRAVLHYLIDPRKAELDPGTPVRHSAPRRAGVPAEPAELDPGTPVRRSLRTAHQAHPARA